MSNPPSDSGLCRDCRQPIRWGETATGRRAPYDLDGGLHFRSCTAAQSARNGSSAPVSPATHADREARLRFAIATAAQLVGQFAQTHESAHCEHIFPLADKVLAWLERGGTDPD